MDLLHGTCGAQNPDVICVTETWLGEEIDNSEISLPGYNIVRLDRHRHGGGVAMYVKNTIDYNVVLCGWKTWKFYLYLLIIVIVSYPLVSGTVLRILRRTGESFQCSKASPTTEFSPGAF